MIMEQILLEAMSKYIEERELIRDSQHFITKCKWCLTNLVAHDEATTSLEKGKPAELIYLYSCEVFDTVLHNILAIKLERYELVLLDG